MSFVGGGSDLQEYYKHHPGSVISTAIDKYVYTLVNERFTDDIRIGYSKVEYVDSIDKIEHNIVREVLKLTGVLNKIELVYMSDLLPAREGSGLGASSSIAVGTLHALHAFKGEHKTSEQLAREACKIEIDILKNPIGKQDQYIAAYGGFNQITFNRDESVIVNQLILSNNLKQELNNNLILFFTGLTTQSHIVLSEQKEKTHLNLEILDKMVSLVDEMRDSLHNKDLTRFGSLLNENWIYKKQLSSKISNPIIDMYYEKGIKAGALGGKILGSGGGGFILFYCNPEKQDNLRKELCNLKEVKFKFDPYGSRILFS